MTARALAVGENEFPFHRLEDAGPLLADAIGDAADVDLTTDRNALVDLAGYDVVVDYLTDSTLAADARDGLLSFVRDGGGYVGVHCAADLTSTAADDPDAAIESRDEPFPELRELVGGHFLDHPERTEFGVEIVDRDHPVTGDVDGFRVFDEPYQVACDEDNRVLARMDHPHLDAYPVAWVREYGTGRVAYVSLGHTEDALTHSSARRLLRNAVRWTADGE